jgi:crotonobetainyl-CoA:carnitine CoA-transferase CaiB-like acyl-CoA transferase
MTIAGGISAALYAREKTGEPSVVDVSLLSAGAWPPIAWRRAGHYLVAARARAKPPAPGAQPLRHSG